MIKIQNLFKNYGLKNILNDISIIINEGEFVVITGESGSGKSTLLNIIGMIDTPTSGTYEFKEQKVNFDNEKYYAKTRIENFGFIFQSYHLINNLTVYENLKIPLIYNGNLIDIDKNIITILRTLGIEYLLNQKTHTLSGGEKQRVVIARVMLQNTKVIIADEPTGNLDQHNSDNILSILKKLNSEGYTIILVTHNVNQIKHATKHYCIVNGEIKHEK